jgi:Holliday junction resolvase RusA-like endonuclease
VSAGAQVLRLAVPGRPVGKQRPRATKRGTVYTPAETRAYEKRVAECGRRALEEAGLVLVWPMAGTYHVTLRIYCGPGAMPDADNVHKSVVDGLIGVLWADDKRVGGSFWPPSQVPVHQARVEAEVVAVDYLTAARDAADRAADVRAVRAAAAELLGATVGSDREARAWAHLVATCKAGGAA